MISKSNALTLVFVLFTVAAGAQELCPPRISSPVADDDFNVPECIPQQAAAALQIAQKWHSDAVLLRVEVFDLTRSGRFQVRFSFYSSSHGTGLWVIRNTATPAGLVNWGTRAIPMNFLDLYAAVKKAREAGMDTPFDQAMLYAFPNGIAWRITPMDDPDLRIFDIDAIQKNKNESWRTSWAEFVQEIQRRINEDPSLSSLEFFVAKEVMWEGHALTRTDYEQSASTEDLITVRMPEANITFPDGRMMAIKNPIQLLIDIKDSSRRNVNITYINRPIRFRATILGVSALENQLSITFVDGKVEGYL